MQKPTLLLLFLVLLAAIAGAFYLPQLAGEPEAPVMTWSESDEVEGSEDEAELPNTEGGNFNRTEAQVTPGAPVNDNEPRIAAILRGRVINKSRQPVAGAKVWLEIRQADQNGRGRFGRGRSRRIPEPVITNQEGLFAFQGDAFRNLSVSLQVKHEQYAVGLFTEPVGDILVNAASADTAEVNLKDLVLDSGARVVGRVVDLDANPVADAEVTLSPGGRNRLRWQRNRRELLEPVRTNGNGYYTFPNVPAADPQNAEFSVSVLAKMHTPGRSDSFKVVNEQEFVVPDIALGPGFEATGFVRDQRGNPIANADVVMRSTRTRSRNEDNGGGRPGRGDRGERGRGGRGEQGGRGRGGRGNTSPWTGRGRDHRTKTDETGKFFLEHLPGSMMELRVTAKGFLNYEQEEIDVKLGQLIQVAMADGLRITGIVQTPDGAPVEQYSMRANRLRGLPDPNAPEIDFNELMAKLRSGNLDAAAQDQIRRQMRSMRDNFSRDGGRGRGGDRGRGRGGDRGRGGRGERNKPETHPEGKFVADGLQEGIYQIVIDSDDFAQLKSEEIEVRHSVAAPDIKLVVDPGVYVAGVVLDDRGDPIVGARVELSSATLEQPNNNTNNTGSNNGRERGGRGGRGGFDFNRMAQSWMRGMNGGNLRLEARTDDEGLFVIKHVPRGVFRLSASADGFTQMRGDPFELEQNTSDFEIMLVPLGSIVGTVTGFLAEELGEVSVGAVMLGENGMPNMFGGRGGRGRGGSQTFKTAKVEADGSYRLDGLASGSYVVRSWLGSTRQLMQQLGPSMLTGELATDVNVQGGEEVTWNMALTRPEVGVVKGLVLHNADPAAGFRVELRRTDTSTQNNDGGRGRGGFGRMFGRNLSATVAASGEFSMKDVPAGQYELRISKSRRGGGVLHKEPLQVFGSDVIERTFSVQTGSVNGTLTAEAGVDVKTLGGRVSLVPNQIAAPTENLRGWLRENGAFDARIQDGTFKFDTLPTGSFLLVVQPRNRAVTSQQLAVSGAETINVAVGAITQAQPTGNGGGNGPGGAAGNRAGGNRAGGNRTGGNRGGR